MMSTVLNLFNLLTKLFNLTTWGLNFSTKYIFQIQKKWITVDDSVKTEKLQDILHCHNNRVPMFHALVSRMHYLI